MKPIINAILSGIKHNINTYLISIDLTDDQKKELAEGLHLLAVDIIEASAKGFAEGLKEEE